MNFSLKSILKGSVVLAALSIESGCGTLIPPASIVAPPANFQIGGSQQSQSSTPDQNPANYTCPSSPNIKPQNGAGAVNALHFFTLCTYKISNNSNFFMIQTDGTLNGLQVCVFAANQNIISANQPVPQTNLNWVSEPGSPQLPLFRCSNLTHYQAFLSFPNTGLSINWNSAFVTTSDNETSMVNCLKTNGNSCPHYSYGQF